MGGRRKCPSGKYVWGADRSCRSCQRCRELLAKPGDMEEDCKQAFTRPVAGSHDIYKWCNHMYVYDHTEEPDGRTTARQIITTKSTSVRPKSTSESTSVRPKSTSESTPVTLNRTGSELPSSSSDSLASANAFAVDPLFATLLGVVVTASLLAIFIFSWSKLRRRLLKKMRALYERFSRRGSSHSSHRKPSTRPHVGLPDGAQPEYPVKAAEDHTRQTLADRGQGSFTLEADPGFRVAEGAAFSVRCLPQSGAPEMTNDIVMWDNLDTGATYTGQQLKFDPILCHHAGRFRVVVIAQGTQCWKENFRIDLHQGHIRKGHMATVQLMPFLDPNLPLHAQLQGAIWSTPPPDIESPLHGAFGGTSPPHSNSPLQGAMGGTPPPHSDPPLDGSGGPEPAESDVPEEAGGEIPPGEACPWERRPLLQATTTTPWTAGTTTPWARTRTVSGPVESDDHPVPEDSSDDSCEVIIVKNETEPSGRDASVCVRANQTEEGNVVSVPSDTRGARDVFATRVRGPVVTQPEEEEAESQLVPSAQGRDTMMGMAWRVFTEMAKPIPSQFPGIGGESCTMKLTGLLSNEEVILQLAILIDPTTIPAAFASTSGNMTQDDIDHIHYCTRGQGNVIKQILLHVSREFPSMRVDTFVSFLSRQKCWEALSLLRHVHNDCPVCSTTYSFGVRANVAPLGAGGGRPYTFSYHLDPALARCTTTLWSLVRGPGSQAFRQRILTKLHRNDLWRRIGNSLGGLPGVHLDYFQFHYRSDGTLHMLDYLVATYPSLKVAALLKWLRDRRHNDTCNVIMPFHEHCTVCQDM